MIVEDHLEPMELSHDTPRSVFKFLDLPPELRLNIYKLYYAGAHSYHRPYCVIQSNWENRVNGYKARDPTALGLVNHQIRDESKEIYYATAIFHVPFNMPLFHPPPQEIRKILSRLPRYPCSVLKNITGEDDLMTVLLNQDKASIREVFPAVKQVRLKNLQCFKKSRKSFDMRSKSSLTVADLRHMKSLLQKDFDFDIVINTELHWQLGPGYAITYVTMSNRGDLKIRGVEGNGTKITRKHLVEFMGKLDFKPAVVENRLNGVPYIPYVFTNNSEEIPCLTTF